jgi:hypothetical protein
VKVYRHFQATNDVERLRKKHRDIWESVHQFERLLAHGQTHGHDRYAGLGISRGNVPAEIWKSRVIYPPLGGKRSGLRYVYERLTIDGEDYAVALTIYIHQDDVRESAVRDRIRERCSSYDATLAALRALEQTTADAE